MASSTVPPFSHSILFKSRIFRNKREIWNAAAARTQNVSRTPTRMLTHIPLFVLPCHLRLRLRPRSLQIRHRTLLSDPPLPPLLRPRSSPLAPPMSSLADPIPTNNKTVRVVVKGLVQGVFFRNWTVDNATELGLKGWVRNRRDGSVEALFSGSPDKVQEMEQRCRRGPSTAIVTGLEVFPCSDDPGTRFERRSTV